MALRTHTGTAPRRRGRSPIGSARYLVSHRRLLMRVARNELAARYAGSLLGIGWVIIAPALILLIYATIYLEIFRVRVTGLSPAEYVVYILSGLVPFLSASEAISVGVSSVVANKAVLNNTVFPIDLAPAKAVVTSQGTMAVGMAAVVAGAAGTGRLHWTILLLPVIWALMLAWLLGLVWLLSLLNVVFRDLQTLVTALLMIMLVASPFAYTPDMVPERLRPILALNPFAYFVVAYQQVVVLGIVPSVLHWLGLALLAGGFLWLGSWFFDRAKLSLIDYV